jgi:hypothetical protein
MKRFLFFIFAFCVLLYAGICFAQPQYLGEFPAGWRFDQYMANGYTVDLIFCGGNGSEILIRQLSSPENPIVPTCYFWVFKSPIATKFIYQFTNMKYIFQLKIGKNTIKVWKEDLP